MNELAEAGVTVSFGERFQASDGFDRVFKYGMALVERTAAYLDGEGRRESKGLPAATTVLYATESMRLTTRLLDLASWLLIRRALKEGEISEIDAAKKRERVKLQSLGRPHHTKGFEELPAGLRSLIEDSFALRAGHTGFPHAICQHDSCHRNRTETRQCRSYDESCANGARAFDRQQRQQHRNA